MARLANFLALWEPRPDVRSRLERDVRSSGEFDGVSQPEHGWLTASGGVGEKAGEAARGDPSLLFAEGMALFGGERSAGGDAWAKLAFDVDHRPSSLGRRRGDFTFVRLRPLGGATLVRSCGGLAPLYFCTTRESVAIATRLDYFARYLLDEPRLDGLVLGAWLTGALVFPDGRAFLRGVSCVPRGGFVEIRADGRARAGSYWDPRAGTLGARTRAAAEERALRLRSVLVDTLDRDLDPRGGNLLAWSGGVDSTALACLGSGTLGRPLSSLTLLPTRPDDLRHELPYLRSIDGRFQFERSWEVPLDAVRALEARRDAPPLVFPPVLLPCCLLPGIQRDARIRVLVGGDLADETCGSLRRVRDWLDQRSWTHLWSAPRRWPAGLRTPRSWLSTRARRWFGVLTDNAPVAWPWLRPGVIAEFDDWRRSRLVAAARDPRPNRWLALLLADDAWLAEAWEAATALGVRPSYPFATREALELAFECPAEELIGPGTKLILRRALRSDLPPLHLVRPDKGAWTPWTGERLGHLVHLTHDDEQAGAIVDLDSLRKAMVSFGFLDALRITMLTNIVRGVRARAHARAAARASTG